MNIQTTAMAAILSAMLFSTSDASAQDMDPQTYRWLLQNPTSAERGDVLLKVQNDQIADYGHYDVSPFTAPRFYQLRPSQEHLQFFYDGQNELYNAAHSDKKADLKALRAKYQQLYNMNDPAYRSEAEYYLGYIDYAEGKYNSALKHFDALPLGDKYQETVPFYRMQILYAKGRWDEAIREANAYTPRDEVFQLEALRIKAECQRQAGQTDQALASYRQYLHRAKHPVASSAYNAGVMEFNVGQYGAATANAGIATQSEYPQLRQLAYMLAGQSALRQGETQQARMAFEQASAISNGDKTVQETAAYNVCAIGHNSASMWGDEVKMLENFLNTYPTSTFADRVSQYLVEVYSTTRNYDAALQSIAKIKAPSQTLKRAKQRLHYQWGVQYYLNALYKEAAAQFDQSIALNSLDAVSYAESYFWRGEARYHQQQYTGAVADYEMFIRLNQRDAQQGLFAAALYNLGYAQMKLENYNLAINAFDRYTSQPGEDGSETFVDGILRLADCYYYTRQFALAEQQYHVASQNESKQRDYALFQEGLMMGLQKKYAEKQTKLDEMLSSCPESNYVADAWLDKGRTSLLQNDAPSAIHSFQQVLDKHSDSPIAPQAAVELAMTYNNLGQTEAAQKIYQMVAERWPETDAAQTAAEDLKTLETQRRIASLPELYERAQYSELLDTYQQLLAENVDFRAMQTMQLLAGKAHLKLGQMQEGTALLQEAANEMRTAAGSEAKYLLAQTAFDGKHTDNATALVNELIQSSTPHQYWLARGIILMSDILRSQGETFAADEYLKSLQQNYVEQDDIQTLIGERLTASADTATVSATMNIEQETTK